MLKAGWDRDGTEGAGGTMGLRRGDLEGVGVTTARELDEGTTAVGGVVDTAGRGWDGKACVVGGTGGAGRLEQGGSGCLGKDSTAGDSCKQWPQQ